MAENAMIRVACPNCGTQYDLDASVMGQTAECPCGAIFMIGTAPEPPPQQPLFQDPAAVQQTCQQEPAMPQAQQFQQPMPQAQQFQQPMPQAQQFQQPPPQQAVTYPVENAPTNTVKISRMSMVGMRPEIQDDFKVGTINASKQNVVTGTASGKFGNRKFTSKKFTSGGTKKKVPPKPKKKWWQFWK